MMKKTLKLKKLTQEQKHNLMTGGLAALLVGGATSLFKLLDTRPPSSKESSEPVETATGDQLESTGEHDSPIDDFDPLSSPSDVINTDAIDSDQPSAEEPSIDSSTDDTPLFDVEIETDLNIAEYHHSTFADAFQEARAAHGPGHIFEYQGRSYTTYYKEEVENLSTEEENSFVEEVAASTHNHAVHAVESTTESSDDPSSTLESEEAATQPSSEVDPKEVTTAEVVTPVQEDIIVNDVSSIDAADFFDPAFGNASEQIVSTTPSEDVKEVVSADLDEVADPSPVEETLLADASDSVSDLDDGQFVVVDDADFADDAFGDVTLYAESSNTHGNANEAIVDAGDFEDPAFDAPTTSDAIVVDTETTYEEETTPIDDSIADSESDLDADEDISTFSDPFEDSAFGSDF